jgi:hypothetical protein
MTRLNSTAGLALALAAAVTAAAQTQVAPKTPPQRHAATAPRSASDTSGFKIYPGATLYTPPATEGTKTFQSNLRPGTKIAAYLTPDSFDKVVAFYRDVGKEYTSPNMQPEQLPNGEPIHRAFLIFDGAADPLSSKSWARIQHPFIGSISQKGKTPEYHDVRDVTQIVLTVKKPVPKEKKDAGPPRSR